MKLEPSKIDDYEFKLFKFVMDNSPDIIYVYDIIEKKNIYSNEGITKVLGYKVKEVQEMGEKIIPLLMHPDDFENYLKNILPKYQESKDNEWIVHDYRMKHKNGDWRWLHSKETIFKRTNSGVPNQILGIISDITNEITIKSDLEDALKKAEYNEHRFNELFRNMNNGCAIYKAVDNGDDFIFIDFNKAAERIEKTRKADLIGKKVTEVFPGIIEFGLHEVFKNVYKTGKAEHFPLTFYKDEKIQGWRDNYVYKLQSEDIVTIYYDRTKEKQAESEIIIAKEKAEENEAILMAAMENSQAGMAIAEVPSGKLKFVNKAGLLIRGKDEEELVRNIDIDKYVSSWQILHFDGTPYKPEEVPLARAVLNGETVSEEFIIKRDDQENRHVWANAAPILNQSGVQTAAIVVFLDITDKYQAELELKNFNEELIKAKERAEESNRLKTEFLNNMSHEIRTPMNGIIGFSDFLDKPDLTSEKQIYYTRIIQNSAKQLLHIIDDILEISTLSTKQVKVDNTTFCLNDLLLELFSIFNLKAQERKIPIYLKKELPDRQCCLKTDKLKLTKVLMNLIENAIKYTNSGFIEIGYKCNEENLQLYVKDTGIGIEPKNQKVIFERFSQEEKEISRNLGGLGLGLSIAKENTELIGGSISLESEKGKGSTFYVNIPCITIDKQGMFGIDSDTPLNAKTTPEYTILIAEDEEVNYLYIETVLEGISEYAIKIIHARNGQEAVDYCKENSSIDLVLMDIKMPVMNGLEASSIIKKLNPALPIIAQTAYTTEAEKQKALDSGCSSFITKPIDRLNLVEIINDFMIRK